MFLFISTLLQISMREKNSYGHFLIAGILLAIFIIFKMLKSDTKISAPSSPVNFTTNNNATEILKYSQSKVNSDPKNAVTGFKRVLELDPENWEASGALGVLCFNTDNASSFKYLNHFYSKLMTADADINSPEFYDLALSFYMLGYHNNLNGNKVEATKLKTAAMKSQEFKRDFASFRLKFSY